MRGNDPAMAEFHAGQSSRRPWFQARQSSSQGRVPARSKFQLGQSSCQGRVPAGQRFMQGRVPDEAEFHVGQSSITGQSSRRGRVTSEERALLYIIIIGKP